jgi:hypothetical protein
MKERWFFTVEGRSAFAVDHQIILAHEVGTHPVKAAGKAGSAR